MNKFNESPVMNDQLFPYMNHFPNAPIFPTPPMDQFRSSFVQSISEENISNPKQNIEKELLVEFSKIVSDGFKKIPSKEDIEKYLLKINKILNKFDRYINRDQMLIFNTMTIYNENIRIAVIAEILKQKSDITAEDIDNIVAQYVNILRSENPDIDNDKLIEYISSIAYIINPGLVKTKLCIYAVFVSALLKNKELD